MKKKDFDPDFTLILFEEPEAFLHPTQQENMAYHLRELGKEEGQQMIISSHSSIFVGKAADDLCQIVKVHRNDGVTSAGQIARSEVTEVFSQGKALKKCLDNFVNDPSIGDESIKKCARKLLNSAQEDEEIAIQEERFQFQLWLDSERASMFFADRVLLVEGATEKALFGWLLARDWRDLSKKRIFIVDAMGKYNFHRYIELFEKFKIPYGLILDDDANHAHHGAVNEMLIHYKSEYRLAPVVFIEQNMEAFLGLEKPNSDHKKPIQILKALEGKMISKEKLIDLKEKICAALALGE